MKNKKRGLRRWRTLKIHRKRIKEFAYVYGEGGFCGPKPDGRYAETPWRCNCFMCSEGYIPIKRHITRAKDFLKDYIDEITPEKLPEIQEDDYVFNDSYFYTEYGAW